MTRCKLSLSATVALILAVITSLACARVAETAVCATSTASVATIVSMPDSVTHAARAVWIWEEDSFKLLDNAAFRNDMRLFLRRQNVSVLYLYADAYQSRNALRDEPDKYRRFIAEMHGHGFEVYALLGSWYLKTPEYILPEKHDVAVRMFRNVLTYNAKADTASRFDGVNIDIEPYLLDDWNEKLDLRASQYLDLAAEFMRMKRQARSGMSVGPAMPFWFDGIEDVAWNGERKSMSEHVQDIFDYVAIMDYRNFAVGRDGIISHASDELNYADITGKCVVIGVETLRTQPEKITFYGLGQAVMEREIGLAEKEFSRHRSFAGFAIHHLNTYRVLAESSGSGLSR